MNSFYSPPEIYYPRWITPFLQQAIEESSVLVLTSIAKWGKAHCS
jgi:hypothetical protein